MKELYINIIIFISIVIISILLLSSHLYSLSKINKLDNSMEDKINKLDNSMEDKVNTEIKALTKIDTKIIADLQDGTKIGSRLNNLDSIIKNDNDNIILTNRTYIPSLHISAPPVTTEVTTTAAPSTMSEVTTTAAPQQFTNTNDYNLSVDGSTTTNNLTVYNNAIINGSTTTNDLTVKNNTFMRGSTTTNDLTVNNDAIINGSTTTNDAIINGTTTTNDAIINGSTTTNDLTVKNNTFMSGSTTINNLTVEGDVKFTNRNTNIMEIFPRYMVIAWASSDIPKGWALCDGGFYKLNADGTINSNSIVDSIKTPDLRGRFVLGSGVGAKDMNNINLTNRDLNTTGGEEAHTLTTPEMPPHKHTFGRNRTAKATTNGVIGDAGFGSDGADAVTNKTGGINEMFASPHNNMPPFYVLTYIMKL